MPRRTLVFITALVLALHWLALRGVPLAWEPPAPAPAGPVFSTRSIAPPPLPAPAPNAPTEARAVAPAPRPQPAPRPRPPARKPVATPEAAPPAPLGGEALATADTGAAPLPDSPVPPVPAPEDPATVAAVAAAPQPPPAAEPPAPPPAAAASAPPLPDTAGGVDITPPGGRAQPAPGAPTPPVRIPPPTRLSFDVSGQAKKFSYSARAELLWQHDGSRYEARQEISAFLVGTRAQRSVGTITAEGLQPERFSDRSRSEQAAHFDAAKGRVTFSANTPDAAVGPGAQDRLSVFLQLGALLAADPGRFVPGTQVSLTTVSARSADRWTFNIEGPDTLDLPSGPTATLKLQRLPRKDYDQKAELWLAPSLGYLPVRIRITQANGDFADLLLRAASPP